MKKLLLVVSILGLMSTTVSAESLVLQTGYAFNNSGGFTGNSAVLDGSFIIDSGLVLGVYLNTNPSDHYSKTANNVKTEIESFGVYSGYQFDNGIRLTFGLDTINYTQDYKVRNKNTSVRYKNKKTSVGYNVGVGYLFDNGVTVSYSYTQSELDSIVSPFDVTSHTILFGYKF